LFIGVELVRDRDTLEPADREAAYVIERMKEDFILLSIDGPFRNVLKIKPPLVFTAGDADRVVTTLDRILSEVERETP
jgi:4-aminobutyrate aminotransferase-like enzyme